jgi:TRAP-type uncharacterized transport system fused permease subunit
MSIAANAQNNETPDNNEVISQEKVEQLIEEFENEAATRKLSGAWAWIAGIVAAALSIYALYWTQAIITTQVYRATFLMLVLALTFFYFPLRKAARAKVPWYDVVLAALGAASMIYLSLNFREALQRVTQPTPTELVMGAIMLLLVLEATRRTTGMALTLVAIFSILYALFGYVFPEPFDHRGISLQRLIGTNYLTLQGVFGVPLDVAATFIVLFTILWRSAGVQRRREVLHRLVVCSAGQIEERRRSGANRGGCRVPAGHGVGQWCGDDRDAGVAFVAHAAQGRVR